MSRKISSSSRDVLTYEGSTGSSGVSGTPGVTGRVECADTLAERVERGGGASSVDGGGAELVGLSSLTMACSMAGRTLKFLSCFLTSDLAAFGAFLWMCEPTLGTGGRGGHVSRRFNRT